MTQKEDTMSTVGGEKGMSPAGDTITREVARKFLDGSLTRDELYRFRRIDDDAAETLAGWEGYLALGLPEISDYALGALARHSGTLRLDYLKFLSVKSAICLAGHRGSLVLNSLEALSPGIAEYLAQNDGGLYLDGLTAISDVDAEHLRA